MGNIGFRKAKCKDCFKCVRICPVKAVRRRNERAQFMARECIQCGLCLESCPQHAISVFSDIDKIKEYFAKGEKVVVTISPAYLGIIDDAEPGQFIQALYQMGFYDVRETAEGAIYVTNEYNQLLEENAMDTIISSACPVVCSLIEKYYPDLVEYLAPVVSPIVAMGQILRREYDDDVKIVSVTSCLAEPDEVLRDARTKGYIDAVISFKELMRWMAYSDVVVKDCEIYHHRRVNPMINGAYAMCGGAIKALRAKTGEADSYKRISVHGIEECKMMLEGIRRGEISHCFVELRSCKSGCVNGPVSGKDYSQRFKSQMYVQDRILKTFPQFEEMPWLKMEKQFRASAKMDEMPTEEQIHEILAKFGKDTPEKELNCGACGYNTCREKAIADFQNRSVIEMCVPYMYEQVRSLTEVIMSVSPDMIIVVDEDLHICEFNNAAEKAFHISHEQAVQKYLYELIDSEDFQEVFETKQHIMNKKVVYQSYGITTLQNIIYVQSQDRVIGFFRNITEEEKKKARSMRMRMDGVSIAQKVIDKQMMVAQEIAGLLGETTAETKMTLSKLRDAMMTDEDEQE